MSRHWYAVRRRGFAEHQSDQSWSVSENAHVKDGHICDKSQYLF